MPAPNALVVELRNLLVENFSLLELADLALDLDVKFDNLPGSTLNEKARELVSYLNRRNQLPRLGEVGPNWRSDLPWLDILGRYGLAPAPAGQAGDAPLPAAPKIGYTDLQQLVPILADYPLFQTPDGRKTVLALAGIESLVNVDLNGSARLVASGLLVQLNNYGRTAEGDVAVARLLSFVANDDALPPDNKQAITAMMARYGLA
ncbi:hypothetical protein [Promineifilum sp.]|uniref:hypothetical protein n=1 Tax=Promineifilum sp. TaxID=2664178 RepID=UPI0035AE58C5